MKKIELKKETLRVLTAREACEIAGGKLDTWCPTCPTGRRTICEIVPGTNNAACMGPPIGNTTLVKPGDDTMIP